MKKKILLVEDDLTMRSLLRTLLELEGFQVLIPKNESDTAIIEAVDGENPDLIIMDAHLQQINGLDVLKSLKSTNKHSNLLIVMVSGMNLEQQCIAAGADKFLLKPYLPSDLIDWIHQKLG